MQGVYRLLALGIACASVLQGVLADPFVVTGVPTGGIQPRFELRDLEENHPLMWNLFIQSLERMQAEKQDDKASYYQIAGIHGAPYTKWDNVGPVVNPNTGYCPHGQTLFGPWHRPYLALFEQRIAFWARRIAEEFPAGQRRDMYTAAAEKIRLPYWDWAENEQFVMPFSMRWPKLEVTRPGGKVEKIDNPLLLYRFHPLDSIALQANTSDQTMREVPGRKSKEAGVESALAGVQSGLRQNVYNFFTIPKPFNTITNKVDGTLNNLEGIHDNIHGLFGGTDGGFAHMAYPTWAAFDPAFWMHHANVDRMLAMWQYLYPDNYITRDSRGDGTYTIAANSPTDGETPLTPFRRDTSGTLWTSNSARNHEVFGYTYPELQGKPSKAALSRTINRLYGSVPGVSQAIERKLKFMGDLNMTSTSVPSGETVYQYGAEISMPQNHNGKSYSVCVYLNDGTAKYSKRSKYEKPAGCQATFGMGNAVTSSVVYLTEAIVEKYKSGECKSLDKEYVTQYLKDNLYYRAEQEGHPIYPRVQVHLSCSSVQPPTDPYGFPTYEHPTPITPINGTIYGY